MTFGTAIAAKVAAKLSPVMIGPIIDQLHDLRERKRELMKQVEVIEAEYGALEEQLMEKLDKEGTGKGAGTKASASISVSVVGNVTDWDKFHAYVKKTGFFHLFQRRLSDPAVRELFDQGKKVPGVEPFKKRRLNLLSTGT
jgi:hypothetical protein